MVSGYRDLALSSSASKKQFRFANSMCNEIVVKAVMGIIGVFVVLFFAMVEDVQSRKIRNLWVLCVFLLNSILAYASEGIEGVSRYVGKVGVCLVFLYILYRSKVIGAGDAKLMAVVLAALRGINMECFLIGSLPATFAITFPKWIRGEKKSKVPLALPMWFGYLTLMVNKGGLM